MITSIQNAQVKNWAKLKMKKFRVKAGLFLVEGEHLVAEVHNSDWQMAEIIVQDGTMVPDFANQYLTTIVANNVFQHITDTKTPQGIAGIVKVKEPNWVDVKTALLLDSIQDPGNLGTMIRTADAVGFDAVIIGDHSVDLYNNKTIRSTQGSLFHIPVFHENLALKIPSLQEEGFTVWATSLENAQPYKKAIVDNKMGLLVGNEGNGVDQSLIDLADYNVNIPIHGKAESLNVSVAAGILMYHISG
ncbi:TrmH family RNA methyltransferase [Virgibacillus necropolis]|uniref:RNA methyltransferase n=1 Tax=Virgibacillus necropolis TaxID=163877 RepID=A0A221MBR6_9BACI|nr:RNA methyltransferase [Virgibacillus necropolis]ASN05049.1 RNA methyltransferase [Virgibacillus necropolis]